VNFDTDVEGRLERLEGLATHNGPQSPPGPVPGTWRHQKMLADQRRAAEEKAKGEAYNAECRRVTEEHKAERIRLFDANAEARASAEKELTAVDARLGVFAELTKPLHARRLELVEIITKFTPNRWPEPKMPERPRPGNPFIGRGYDPLREGWLSLRRARS